MNEVLVVVPVSRFTKSMLLELTFGKYSVSEYVDNLLNDYIDECLDQGESAGNIPATRFKMSPDCYISLELGCVDALNDWKYCLQTVEDALLSVFCKHYEHSYTKAKYIQGIRDMEYKEC